LGNSYITYRFETLHKFGGALVIFEVFDDKHYNVVVLELAEVLDHQLFDEGLQLAIDQLLA
jgi:hypothetical protein